MRNNFTIFYVIGVILLGNMLTACAQITKADENYNIKGTTTTQGEPLSLVNIYIKELEIGATSNDLGMYYLQHVPEGSYTFIVSSIGFETIRKNIYIGENSESSLDFSLLPSNDSLDQIVITGTLRSVTKSESPVPIEVYGKSFFKKNPAPSLFESFQNINGVRSQLNCNICNTGDIQINGLEGPYTFILIDGLPIVSGLSTVYGLSGIPQALIERIEIVKGPASTLYGSEAVGGVINIITKKPSGALRISADSFSTSWAEVNTDLGVRYGLSEKSDGLLGVNYFNYQNPIDNNEDGFTDLTLQNRVSIFNKITTSRDNSKSSSIAGRYIYEDRWGGEMNYSEDDRGSDQIYGESIYTSRWEVFGNYDFQGERDISFQFSGNGHSQNSFYGTTSYKARQYIGFGQLLWHQELGKAHQLLMGAAYRYNFYDDNTFATLDQNGVVNQPSIIHLPGVFLQDEINIKQNHTLLLGLRYDYNSIHGNVFSPRVNYKWASQNKEDVVRISLGNGFRVANIFTEDHAALTGARQVIFDGELQPETSWNGNINYVKNIKTENNTFINLDATAFYTYFTNRILPDYETNSNQIIYSNLDGNSISKGISLNTNISFRNGLKILVGATVMDVSVTENNITKRQLLTEGYSGTWSISYKINAWNINLDYTGNLYGPMRLPLLSPLDPREEYSPLFSIQNIQLTKYFNSSWEIYAGVKNLLNFTPPSNSISRPFDPFDNDVQFDQNGQAVPTRNNPNALTFDPTYVFASNQGIHTFLGLRYTVF